MAAKTRADRRLQRIVFAGFALSMVAEWVQLRRLARNQRTEIIEVGDTDGNDTTGAAQHSDRASTDFDSRDPIVPVGVQANDTIASLTMLVGMLITSQLVWGPFHRRWDRWWYARRIANLGTIATGPLGRLASWGAAMLTWDLVYYWEHRWMHRVRVLWAHHVTHHSSQRYNLSTALRQPWSNILTHWVFTPMMLAGFPPEMVRKAGEWNLVYQYWIHTEAIDQLPMWVERVFNTASHHRVHHGSNPEYLDRNFGGIFIVWDKLFGTFTPERRRVRYGLTHNIDSFHPLRIAYHEMWALAADLRATARWRDRVGVLLKPPGWVPTPADAAGPTPPRRSGSVDRGDDRLA